jgi:hypothetical protein
MGHTQRNWRHGYKKRLSKGRGARTTRASHPASAKDATTKTDELLQARDDVFGTYELLEFILSHLDMQTLLVAAQRVCKQWRNLITVSHVLQRQLFFEPCRTSKDGRLNNPLLELCFPVMTMPERYLTSISQEQVLEGRRRSGRHRQGHHAITRRGASWRRMLLCQPPLRNVILTKKRYRDISDVCCTTFPNGVRMGQYYDLIFSILWRLPVHGMYTVFAEWGNFLGSGLSDAVKGRVPEPEVNVQEFYDPYGLTVCYRKHTVAMDGCTELYERKCHKRWISGSRWMAECEGFEPWAWETKLKIRSGEIYEEEEDLSL